MLEPPEVHILIHFMIKVKMTIDRGIIIIRNVTCRNRICQLLGACGQLIISSRQNIDNDFCWVVSLKLVLEYLKTCGCCSILLIKLQVQEAMEEIGTSGIPLSVVAKAAEIQLLYAVDRVLLGSRWFRKATGIQPKLPYLVDSFERRYACICCSFCFLGFPFSWKLVE